jgi:hypothetical protein
MIRVKLHCIPPAIRMSSLPVRRPVRVQPANSSFQPRIIHPDLEFQRQQNVYRQTLNNLVKQLMELTALATEPGEISYWQQKIDHLKGK